MRTTILIAAIAASLATAAAAQGQQRFYDARGNPTGTAVPQSDGTTRFYDARGNSIGSATTSPSGSTTFYDSRGNVTGRSTAPPLSGGFRGRR